jgi:hypothetical protein
MIPRLYQQKLLPRHETPAAATDYDDGDATADADAARPAHPAAAATLTVLLVNCTAGACRAAAGAPTACTW